MWAYYHEGIRPVRGCDLAIYWISYKDAKWLNKLFLSQHCGILEKLVTNDTIAEGQKKYGNRWVDVKTF